MFNPDNMKEIVFPHTFGAFSWPGKQYVWNDVNGGAVSIGSLGYTTNGFLGGRCIKLGFIKELGFYGCQDKNHQEGSAKLLGYHIENPMQITQYGKEMLEKMYPKNTIAYVRYETLVKKPVGMAGREQAEKEARAFGIPESTIKVTHVDTLKDLVRAAKFEQVQEEAAMKKAAVQRPAGRKPVTRKPAVKKPVDVATEFLVKAAEVKVSVPKSE
jgi:hypothetical protein